jgi:hypothetical protein
MFYYLSNIIIFNTPRWIRILEISNIFFRFLKMRNHLFDEHCILLLILNQNWRCFFYLLFGIDNFFLFGDSLSSPYPLRGVMVGTSLSHEIELPTVEITL